MRAAVRTAVAAALGEAVRDTRSLSGGDINDAYRATLASGRSVFVKTNDTADPRMFPCEARGLAWLAAADSLRVPRVLAVSDDSGPHFLILELIEPGRRARTHDEQLGHGLAALHRASADSFGLDHDNFIATFEQANPVSDSWPDFYARQRLAPLAERAIEHGQAPDSWRQRFARLTERMTVLDPNGLCGPAEPPARLHGDLWSGNVHTDENGRPCLIDPAVYGGHREIDLAMLALFGGLSERTLAAYNERYPLAPGFAERVPLYQLYPLLVHVNLFGGGYVSSVERALQRYL